MATAVYSRACCLSLLMIAMFAGHLSGEEVANVGRMSDAQIANFRKQEGIRSICSDLRNNREEFAIKVARKYGLQSEVELNEYDEPDETQPELRLESDVAAAVFDTFLYGGGGYQIDESPVRERLESILRKKINSIHKLCELTDDQKERLHLAGKGDVKRLFDNVAAQRMKFVAAVNGESPSSPVGLVTSETSQIRNRVHSDPFDNDSLFAKVLRSHLKPTQVEVCIQQNSNFARALRLMLQVPGVARQQ